MFTGICTTTSSGLANALTLNALNFGVLVCVADFKTTFATTYLATLCSCTDSSPTPDSALTSKSQVESLLSFIDSNLFDKYNSTVLPFNNSSTSTLASTNCLFSAVKKSAGAAIINPSSSNVLVC